MNIATLISDLLNKFNRYFTDYITVVLLLVAGVYFTFKTRFVQVRCFGEGIRGMFCGLFQKKDKSQGITPFAALATAIGSQVGIGNIVGVSAAILIGGAGTVFWMWVSAFFGMATVYVEAVSAQITRKNGENGYYGGPVFYIRKAIGGKLGRFLAGIFSFSAVFALGGSGSMIQSNAVAKTVEENLSVPVYICGAVLSLLCFLAFIGGVKRITALSEKLVVMMAVVFLAVCSIVILINITKLPLCLNLIFKTAFNPTSIAGCGVGEALRIMIGQGIKKGLFSNEAGLGTTPHIHAAVNSKSPHSQGVVAMMGVFVDSFVIMTVSALVMLIVLYDADGTINNGLSVNINNMMLCALTPSLGEKFSQIFLSISLFLFGYSSLISWSYFGRVNFEYLFGKSSGIFYTVFSVIFVFAGCVFKSEFVWSLADAFNNFMVLPNIVALLLLSVRCKNMSKYTNNDKFYNAICRF